MKLSKSIQVLEMSAWTNLVYGASEAEAVTTPLQETKQTCRIRILPKLSAKPVLIDRLTHGMEVTLKEGYVKHTTEGFRHSSDVFFEIPLHGKCVMLRTITIKIQIVALFTIFCLNFTYAAEPGDYPEGNIKLLHVTDNERHIIDTAFAIDRYNDARDTEFVIDAKSSYQKAISRVVLPQDKPFSLADLIGINVVLYDIKWEQENGDRALARLVTEAASGFILPPFIAVTDDPQYHNTNLKQSQYAKDHHFFGGYKQISTEKELQHILVYCEEMLGRNWLATGVGRFTPPSHTLLLPAVLVEQDIRDVVSVMTDSCARSTLSPIPSPRPGESIDSERNEQSSSTRTVAAIYAPPPTQVRRKPSSYWRLCCCFPLKIVPAGNGRAMFAY